MHRRTLLALIPAIALAPALLSPHTEEAFAQGIDQNAILNDPEAPVSGNPKGDLTIVAFLDYNCPFCKKAEPDLIRLVKADGRIRLVHKDWPILGDASVYGAQLALAARYQGRYDDVHRALMGIPGRKIPKERMLEAVSAPARTAQPMTRPSMVNRAVEFTSARPLQRMVSAGPPPRSSVRDRLR